MIQVYIKMIRAWVQAFQLQEALALGQMLGEFMDVKFTRMLFQAVRVKQEMACRQQAAMNWKDAGSFRLSSPTRYDI